MTSSSTNQIGRRYCLWQCLKKTAFVCIKTIYPLSDQSRTVSNARQVVLRDRDGRTLLLITKVNALIGNNFQSTKIMNILFFFRHLFNRYSLKNYPETMRKQIEQKVCTLPDGRFVCISGGSRPWAKGEGVVLFYFPCRLFSLHWFPLFLTKIRGTDPSPRSAT